MKKNEGGAKGHNERLLGALLRIPFQALTTRIQQGLVAAGHPEFHASHLAILQHIQAEGTQLSELVERSQMTKQAINYLVEYLEELGYLQRVPNPQDGRARIIYLTDLGWQADRLAREIIKRSESEWAMHLGTKRMEQLQQTLRDLAALIEEEGK